MRRRTLGKMLVLLLVTGLVCATTAQAKKPTKPPPPAAYDITDLGTLGGAGSQAWGMHGTTVVGHAETSVDYLHATLWQVNAQGTLLATVDLGTLSGGDVSRANSVNDQDQIVGKSETGEYYEDPNNPGEYLPVEHAVLWRSRASGPEDLGTLPLGNWSSALAISDTGFIVGQSENVAVLWWIDDSGIVQGPINLVGPGASWAVDVNDDGLVAIDTPMDAYLIVPEDTNEDGIPDCWFLDIDGDGVNDLLRYLGYLDDKHKGSDAAALNEVGQVTGESMVSKKRGTAMPNFLMHAYRITPEDTDGDGVPDLWNREHRRDGTNELMEDLGTIKAFENNCNYGSFGNDLNDAGKVVGKSVPNCRAIAVLFDDGDIIKLIDVIPEDAGWSELLEATSINNDDQIAGYGRLDDGTARGFVLTPLTAP